MENSDYPFSLSSLMCEEDETSFLEDDDENTEIDSLDDPCFILDNEEEYIEYLFRQETGFGFHSHFLSHDAYSNNSTSWLRSARMAAIDWIFNVQAKFGFKIHTAYLSVTYFDRFLSKRSIEESKAWAIQLLSVACLSLAAKMEEQKVPPLSEYPIDYRFENRVIMNMELLILGTLEWKMGSATPFAYLNYFITKFCPGSRPETIITKATKNIVAMVKDVNLMDQRPSIIASAAILAAFDDDDATLTRKTIELRLSEVSSWGSQECEHAFACYNLMQEKKRISKVKTPSSNFLSTHSSSMCVLEDLSATSTRTKRKLTFGDSEDCPSQKQHRP